MKKITKEEFERRLKEKFPNEPIEILKYEKMSGPVDYKCLICGEQHYIYKGSDLLYKKHLCNKCWYSKGKGEQTKQEQKEAIEIIKKSSDLEFIKFGYNNKLMKNTIIFRCKKCGLQTEWQLKFFLKRKLCPGCSYNSKHFTTKGAQSRLKDYTLLEDYESSDKKLLVRHNECGFIWKTTVHNLISGYGCPKCSKKHSKGEKKIIEWLNLNKIDFISEKTFVWSNNKRYDFFLPKYNLVIEYMGIQHYKEVPHFNLSLKEQQQIDNWKKEQALLNHLNYLSISYEDFDIIEDILVQRLSHNESRS